MVSVGVTVICAVSSPVDRSYDHGLLIVASSTYRFLLSMIFLLGIVAFTEHDLSSQSVLSFPLLSIPSSHSVSAGTPHGYHSSATALHTLIRQAPASRFTLSAVNSMISLMRCGDKFVPSGNHFNNDARLAATGAAMEVPVHFSNSFWYFFTSTSIFAPYGHSWSNFASWRCYAYSIISKNN